MRNENPVGENMNVTVLLQEAGQALGRSELNRAEELYKQALTYLDYHNRGDSAESALCLQSLAEIYYQSGQPQSAIPLYRRLLTLGEQILGPHHAEVIAAAYRLASTYEQTHMEAEAEDMYKRAASSAERTFGLDHPASQKIRDSLLAFVSKRGSAQNYEIPPVPPKMPANQPFHNGNEELAAARPSEPQLDFMPPPPPKSPSRLREMERGLENQSQSVSGKQREYQSTQSGVDFGLLAENTGPSKTIKKMGPLYKRPTKIKHLRYGAESAEEAAENALTVKNIIRRFDVIAYLTVSVIAIAVFTVVLFTKMSSVSSASYEDAVTALLKTTKHFQSIDGVSGIEFADNGPYVTLMNDVKHRRIPYVILKGGLSDIGTMITSAFIHKEVWYQSIGRALTGDNGVTLFAQDSPDMNVQAAMKSFESFLDSYFKQQGTYPSNERRYKDNVTLSYTNPYTQRPEVPSLTTMDLKTDKEFLFPGIKNASKDDAVLVYLREGGNWRDPNIPRPGRVCALGLRHGVEKKGDNYLTTEMYIMAYNKDLHLISAGLPGITYVIGMKDGKTLSDEEADRKLDVEQASVHPPDRICIVRGDTENIGMMRQAVPTTLVFIFIGSFLGFLFLEFKSRKAEPHRLPQTFEVIGGLSLSLLVIIWIIHILP
jgi:hypothetical protein